jgi:hypothetical protein
MEDRVHALGEVAWDVLHRMVHSSQKGGAPDRIERSELSAARSPALKEPGGSKAFSEALVATLDGCPTRWSSTAASGRGTFCHLARRGLRAPSPFLPPRLRRLPPTGMPSRRISRSTVSRSATQVDRLYAEPPAFVTLVHDASSLRGAARAFTTGSTSSSGGSPRGFFPTRSRAEEAGESSRSTFQIADLELGGRGALQ